MSTKSKDELKCCPFCGALAQIDESAEGDDGDIDIWIIKCSNCQAEMRGIRKTDYYIKFILSKYISFPKEDEKEKIIKAWNNRTTFQPNSRKENDDD